MAQQSQTTMPIETHLDENNGSPQEGLLATNGSLARLKLQKSEGSKMSVLTNKSVPPPGTILTGKQEHCTMKRVVMVLINLITLDRHEARTYIPASQVGDFRIITSNRIAKIWCSFLFGCRRGCPEGLRISYITVHV